MKISVVIITKNEERIIGRCLDSIRWADEIVIVDSRSTDKTVEIAKRYTAKIIKKPWQGFAKQKNFAISKAKHPWILSLDADEIITSKLKDEIMAVIKNGVANGYFIPRKNFFYGKLLRFGNIYPDSQLRLFKKGCGSFEETQIHKRLKVSGQLAHIKSAMLHYSKENIQSHINSLNSYTQLEVNRALEIGYKPTGYSVLIKPILYFTKHYIFRAGFLDGIAGLVYYSINCVYIFLREIKIMETLGISKFNLISTIFKRAR